MIQSSRHLWRQINRIEKDFIDESWQISFSPLLNEFYHPYYHVMSSQILDEDLFSEENGTIFLKDGILPLLHFFSRIIKNKALIKSNFALPTYMASIVPKELREFFVFYCYEAKPVDKNTLNNKCLLFIPPIKGCVDLEFFNKQLANMTGHYNELLLLRPELREDLLHALNGSDYDLIFFNQCLEIIKKHLPNARITHIIGDRIFEQNLEIYDYVNTNHTHFFYNEDFFSYYYFFKLRQLPFPPPSYATDYPLVKSIKLIKDLVVHFHSYQGHSIITKEEFEILSDLPVTSRIFIDPNNANIRNAQFYNKTLLDLATSLSVQLLNISKKCLV